MISVFSHHQKLCELYCVRGRGHFGRIQHEHAILFSGEGNSCCKFFAALLDAGRFALRRRNCCITRGRRRPAVTYRVLSIISMSDQASKHPRFAYLPDRCLCLCWQWSIHSRVTLQRRGRHGGTLGCRNRVHKGIALERRLRSVFCRSWERRRQIVAIQIWY